MVLRRAVAPQELIAAAEQATANAYAPYSHWRVGAAALFAETPEMYLGVNVENASYGLTICAERSAIVRGVSCGNKKLVSIAVCAHDRNDNLVECFFPCGACLQVIAEFANPDTTIFVGKSQQFRLNELLPKCFHLPQH